ncbi:MAG: imidazole glycerol phosphate synthase subunit HisH [Myxococcales bacterium]|jgi:glutamine amidotransferase
MIAIVDYNAGNLRSVKRACDAVGIEAVFTRDPDEVARAERVIFPGVGHARSAMETLVSTGLREAVVSAFERGAPVLGICVGAQLLLDGSEEGPTEGLALIPGMTRRFTFDDPTLKIPHIGWNAVRCTQPHPLLESLQEGDELYFVHSYYMEPSDPAHVFAVTDYGGEFACAIGRDNLFATQFHPEKSGRLGLELLRRFARWEGTPC